MTYFDSAEDVSITKARALKELADHGTNSVEDITDFIKQCGDHETYNAQLVLMFLGY